MSAFLAGSAIRRMPVLDVEKRRLIFRNIDSARETIIGGYHQNIFSVDLAKAIAQGKTFGIMEVLNSHPIVKKELYSVEGRLKEGASALVSFLKEISHGIIANTPRALFSESEGISEYLRKKDRKLEERQGGLGQVSRYVLELVDNALSILPKVMSGRIRSSVFSSKIAWAGSDDNITIKSGKLVLVLSGGSAKGVFYTGFLRAFQERNIYPDFIVGASAGAIAGSVFASGKRVDEIEKIFSPKMLRRIFSPLKAPLTLLFSLGSGIVGMGLGKALRRVLGERTFSEIADLFIITTVQKPVDFGKVVIGRASAINANIALSSNLPVWKAAWGSASMQGIIPQPTAKKFTAERLVNGDFGVKVESIHLPYATLDDGAVVEHMPIMTAKHLLEEMGEKGVVIAVNLANLNPMRVHGKVPRYSSFSELLQIEFNRNGSEAKPYQKPFCFAIALGKWIMQEWKRRVASIAPFRALGAYDAISLQNAEHAMEIAKGNGMNIIVNPNCDGSLDGISLRDFGKYEKIKKYGYDTGKEVVDLLLGVGIQGKGEPKNDNHSGNPKQGAGNENIARAA